MSNAIDIAREVLGVPKAPIMESEDLIVRLQAERDELAAMVVDLRAERGALAERLRQSPDLRSIVGELREIYWLMESGKAATLMLDLLRRIDRESQ